MCERMKKPDRLFFTSSEHVTILHVKSQVKGIRLAVSMKSWTAQKFEYTNLLKIEI